MDAEEPNFQNRSPGVVQSPERSISPPKPYEEVKLSTKAQHTLKLKQSLKSKDRAKAEKQIKKMTTHGRVKIENEPEGKSPRAAAAYSARGSSQDDYVRINQV